MHAAMPSCLHGRCRFELTSSCFHSKCSHPLGHFPAPRFLFCFWRTLFSSSCLSSQVNIPGCTWDPSSQSESAWPGGECVLASASPSVLTWVVSPAIVCLWVMSSWCWCVTSSTAGEVVLTPERPGEFKGLIVRGSFQTGQTDNQVMGLETLGYIKQSFEGQGRSHSEKTRR